MKLAIASQDGHLTSEHDLIVLHHEHNLIVLHHEHNIIVLYRRHTYNVELNSKQI